MKYAIVGRGRSGRSAAEFLTQRGAEILFLDDADGSLTPEQILSCDALVLSPGVPRTHRAIQAALKADKPIYNEIDLAVAELSDCQFVGVTGTNGKSTTTALLGHILSLWEPDTFVGGNLGTPLCEAVSVGGKPKYAVLELSSYQLETLSRLKLRVAILLNLSPDHLDRYESPEAYYQTKQKIFDLLLPGGTRIELPPAQMPQDFRYSRSLIGTHNLQNMRAAILAAQALGVPDEVIQKGLDTFAGMPHRLEILGEKKGVIWVNDSKATTVESVLAALACFDSGVHLILGGLGKGVSYAPLAQAAKGKVKAVYAIGQDTPVILEAFPKAIEAKTLETAVRLAHESANPGDTVLLSPACASYDQFKNFEHRGEVFRSLFHGL